MSSQKVTDEQVFDALRKCMDPEIPVNVVDLGLIYNVRVHPTNDVGIEMTMTTRGCPLHDTLDAVHGSHLYERLGGCPAGYRRRPTKRRARPRTRSALFPLSWSANSPRLSVTDLLRWL